MNQQFQYQSNFIDELLNSTQKDSDMVPESTLVMSDSSELFTLKCPNSKKIIKFIDFTSNLKKGTNIAKFIVISFASKIESYKKLYGLEQKKFQSTNEKLKIFLLKSKNSLNLSHLIQLFGKSQNSEKEKRNLLNCKVLSVILQQCLLDLVMSNPKIEDKITYMNCVLRYVGRLQNQLLCQRIQSR